MQGTEAGAPGAPVVLLTHGFPELAYSWRHQIPVLADAGYHVLAPDQRGYGGSSRPGAIEGYNIRGTTTGIRRAPRRCRSRARRVDRSRLGRRGRVECAVAAPGPGRGRRGAQRSPGAPPA